MICGSMPDTREICCAICAVTFGPPKIWPSAPDAGVGRRAGLRGVGVGAGVVAARHLADDAAERAGVLRRALQAVATAPG